MCCRILKKCKDCVSLIIVQHTAWCTGDTEGQGSEEASERPTHIGQLAGQCFPGDTQCEDSFLFSGCYHHDNSFLITVQFVFHPY